MRMREMPTKNVEFGIDIANFDPDAAKRLKAARDEVAKIEREIVAHYQKSDRLKAVCDLAAFGDYGTKYNVVTSISSFTIVSRVNIELPDEKTFPARQAIHLGEKTINMLLSGKLLTDGQKKELLKQIGFDPDSLINNP